MILVLLILLVLSPSPAFGQATDSAEFDQKVQQSIKDRIDKVVEEKATASGEILAAKTLDKRAWVGTLTNIANQTLTLKTGNLTRQVSLSDATVYVQDPGRKRLAKTDLELGKTVIAMGFVNGGGVLTAKRIVVLTQPTLPPVRSVYLGTLDEFTPVKNLLTLTSLPDQQSLNVSLTSTTRINRGPDQVKATAANLESPAKVLIIATTDSAGKLVAALIHLL